MQTQKPNKRLLKKIMKKIETNPKCWDQETWHCGTSHCFAGHTSLEVLTQEFGYNEKKDNENNLKLMTLEQKVVQKKKIPRLDDKSMFYHLNDPTSLIAAHYLGLNKKQAKTLFTPSNTRKKLREKVDKICRGEL